MEKSVGTALCACAILLGSGVPQAHASSPSLFARQSLSFLENRGQVDGRVGYYAEGGRASVYFTRAGVTFALRRKWAVQQRFVGGQRGVQPEASRPAPGVVNSFVGPRRRRRTGLRRYGRVAYRDVWRGIDVVYDGRARGLESSFVIRPGADPRAIRVAYRGARALAVSHAGRLRVSTPAGAFSEHRPIAYQQVGRRRMRVPVRFAARRGSSRYGFRLGAYDRGRPLVIDPVVYGYAGFLGGTGDDQAFDADADASGNAYVGGTTTSTDFPASPGPLSTPRGNTDGFVAKVDPTGRLVYADYIGGVGRHDDVRGIAVDPNGNAYVAGSTDSPQSSFPVTVGPDLTFNGGEDVYAAKLDPTGKLVYAGYIGGDKGEGGRKISVDAQGNAYVAGTTSTADRTFPALVGPDLTYGGGRHDGFVAKVNAAGTGLVWCSYVGGTGDEDNVRGTAPDAAGDVYITGHADSPQSGFPVTVGPDLTYNGKNDGYVGKITADGTAFAYLGYVGGSGLEQPRRVAIDAEGNAYITGSTESTDFPVTVGPDLSFNGPPRDAFITKVNPQGTGLVYSGFIGGGDPDPDNPVTAGDDQGYGLDVDAGGSAYVVGLTTSREATFPVKDGPDLTFNGGYQDGFIAKVDPSGRGLDYAGYIGGEGDEVAQGVGVDTAGRAYVSGATSSTEATFPTLGAPDSTFNGGPWDAFLVSVAPDPASSAAARPAFAPAVEYDASAGEDPQSVAAADFDEDGRPDLATADARAGAVSLLLQGGTGAFAPAAGWPVATGGDDPRSLVAADFDEDGHADIATANRASGDVSVMLGDGDGGLRGGATRYPVAPSADPGPFSVQQGDFNHDRHVDLVTANENTNEVSVLLGNGDGSLGAATTFAVGARPRGLAVGDVNGDGFDDVVIANFDGDSVTVLLGDGTGQLAPPVGSLGPIAVGDAPRAVTLGDFDEDGNQDIATANSFTTSDTSPGCPCADSVTVLLGDGAGNFAQAPDSPFSTGADTAPVAVRAADLDADGHLDLVTANRFGDGVSVLAGDGRGGFGLPATFPTPASGVALADLLATDLDGDDRPDLAAPEADQGRVAVFLNSTTIPAPFLSGTTPTSPANDNQPEVRGNAEDGLTVHLYPTPDCSGPELSSGSAAEFPAGLPVSVAGDAATTFYATATTRTGRSSACSSTSATYTEDSTAPAAPTGLATTPVSPASDITPSVAGTAEAGSTVKVYATADCTGSPVTATAADLQAGVSVLARRNATTSFTATAADAAGNTSDCSPPVSYTEASTAPAAPSGLHTTPASPGNDTAPGIAGAAEVGSTVRLYATPDCSGASEASGSAAQLASPGITVAVARGATRTFGATATDADGNVSPCSSPVSYTQDDTAPAIYYVHRGSTGLACTRLDPCRTIDAALALHRGAPRSNDVIDLGVGTFFANLAVTDPADAGLTIRGALAADGSRATTIRATGSGTATNCASGACGVVLGAGPGTAVTLADLNVDTVGADPGVTPVELAGGSDLVDVHVSAVAGATASQIVAVGGDSGTRIVRSWLESDAGGAGAGVRTAGDLTLDSSLVTGGLSGVAFAGTNGGALAIQSSTVDAGQPGVRDGGAEDVDVSGTVGAPAVAVTVASSILADDLRVVSNGESGSVTCTHSDLQHVDADAPITLDCAAGGMGNASTDPAGQFAGGSPFDWRLRAGAPAIETGDPAASAPGESTLDLAGNARVQAATTATCPAGVRDKGAYERASVSCIPRVVRPPAIERASSPLVGVQLGSNVGSWSPAASSYGRQWLRCDPLSIDTCTVIAGRTGSTYAPTGADVGHVLRLRVVASNSAGASAPATSAPSGVVAGSVPVMTSPPTIKGPSPPAVGSQLGANAGKWSPAATSYQRTWLRCQAADPSDCAETGRTGSGYKVGSADAGDRIRLRIVAINAAGSSAPALSAPTAVVP